MSYILDALRRADSERERGTVPGIHAQPEPLLSPAVTSEPKRIPWPWIAAAGAATVAVLLTGYLLGRDIPREEAQVAMAPAAASVAPTAAAPQRIADAPARAVPAEEGAARSSPARTAADMPAGTTRAMSSVETAPPPRTAVREAASDPAAAPVASAAPATPPGPANDVAEPRINLPSELPDHIRNELPAITIGGSIYSSNPASRSLIVNGRVLREKDRVASDLTLEEIRLKSAVLKYKGYLYEITY